MIFSLRNSIIILVYTIIALATKTSASTNKLKIISDNLIVKTGELSATFEGSVIVKFDDITLTTSKLTVLYSDLTEKKEINKIIFPVKLKATRNCGKEIIFANKGEYNNSIKKLTLEGNIKMLKDENVLATNKLVYSAQFRSLDQKKNEK